jgi:hypothetical protein
VADTLAHLLKALRVALKGPRTEGPMVADPVSRRNDVERIAALDNTDGYPLMQNPNVRNLTDATAALDVAATDRAAGSRHAS